MNAFPNAVQLVQSERDMPSAPTASLKPSRASRATTTAFAVLLMLGLSPAANAVDGCKVLLCLAAPDWSRIQECVPTIHQLHRDLARGRPFPRCETAGAGTDSGNDYTDPPWFCPAQYTHREETEDRVIWRCDYAGAIWTLVNGQPFTRTWWNEWGGSVTEYSDYAKGQLGTWNPRFDDEYAEWAAAQPPAPSCTGCEP